MHTASGWSTGEKTLERFGAKRQNNWRRGSESNRRIKVLQTSPLPLGYRAPIEAGPYRPDSITPRSSEGIDELELFGAGDGS
jgi:hypothetical protein